MSVNFIVVLIIFIFSTSMNYSRTLFSCLIFLFITACDTQIQTASPKKTTEVKTTEVKTTEVKTKEVKATDVKTTTIKTTEIKPVPVVAPAKVSTEPKKILPPLKLSIGDISLEDKKNDGTEFINNSGRAEKNSALFDRLNEKGSKSKVNLSGEVLTDKITLENQRLIRKVDGLQINVEAGFD